MGFANQSNTLSQQALPLDLRKHAANDYSDNANSVDNMNSYTERRALVNDKNGNYDDENDSIAESDETIAKWSDDSDSVSESESDSDQGKVIMLPIKIITNPMIILQSNLKASHYSGLKNKVVVHSF